MKKLSLLSLLFAINSFSQISFEHMMPEAPYVPIVADFNEIEKGGADYADIDGDGDLDVFINGSEDGAANTEVAEMYINQGNGRFLLDPTTIITGTYLGDCKFADVDGDLDPDLVITGSSNSQGNISQLYINDGLGNFTLSPQTFTGYIYSTVNFSDVDGDLDLDLMLAGAEFGNFKTTKLYLNDGFGVFNEDLSAPFSGIKEGAIKFGDIDLDGDDDVLLCGNILSGDSTELYLNDGAGNFTLDPAILLMGLERSDAVFEDLDGDNYPDILISGRNNAGQHKTNLYQNNGLGNFIDLGPSVFAQCHETSFASDDIDNDGDLDIVMVGKTTTSYHTGMYMNQGAMSFNINSAANMEGAAYGFTEIFDMNQDGLKEVLMCGRTSAQSITKCYYHDGGLNFPRITGNNVEGVTEGEGEFGDVNGDGFIDLFTTGLAQGSIFSEIHLNDGTGKFIPVPLQPFANLYASAVEMGDIDGDGDLDIVLAGTTGSQQHLWKYKNDGTGNFTFFYQNLPGSGTGDMEMFDCDGDSDLDLLIAGSWSGTILYLNDGTGVFTNSGNSFQFLGNAACDHVDIDGDGDQDIINAGLNGVPITNLYINDGLGNYTLVSGTPFVGVEFGDVKFADIDGDGDQDALVLGKGLSSNLFTELYKNDGLGNFSSVSSSLIPIDHGSAEFFDADGDLDLDLLISGEQVSNHPIAKFYVNDGAGFYTELPNMPFSNAELSNIASGDINNDGDIDIFLMGEEDHHIYYSRIYENTTCIDNVFSNDTICSGDSYTFPDGSTFTVLQSDTTHKSYFTSVMGCDSIIHTSIHAKNTFTQIHTVNICDGDSYIFPDGSSIASVAIDTLQESMFTASNGCDSIIKTQLLVVPVYSISNLVQVCAGLDFVFPNGDTIHNVMNDSTHTSNLLSIHGCDSIVQTQLTVQPTDTTIFYVQVCEGVNYGFPNGDTLYNVSSDSSHNSLYTNTYGCDSIVTTELTVLFNTFYTDTQSACLSYQWIDGNTYNTSNSTATHVLNNAVGCDSIITLNLSILNDTSTSIVSGTISSNNSGATSYQWIDCSNNSIIPGADSISFTPTQNGSYAVVVTAGPCTDTSACHSIAGLNFDEYPMSNLSVYPNPSLGQIFVELTNKAPIEQIKVYNVSGEVVYENNAINKQYINIDLGKMTDGIYLINVTSESSSYSRKVIINKL